VGSALGKEARAEEVSVLLGPGLNLKRNPLGGRNFEYFSEDPYLSGKLAAAMTRGIQKEGVSACPKHFAVNSQETRRMIMDEIVDERALHELYLEGFRYAVREGNPKTLMTSYNKVNGTFANEHLELLRKTLIEDFGFQGVVVTDWGGNNDRVRGLLAGNTLEMPSTFGMTDEEIVEAVNRKDISEDVVDLQVDKLLTLIEGTLGREHIFGDLKKESASEETERWTLTDQKAMHEKHHQEAVDAARKSIVLLKNEDEVLPLQDSGKRIAVIGDFAENPRYQGAGSSLIEPVKLVSLKEALEDTSLEVIGYEKGYRRLGRKDRALGKKALDLARKSDLVLFFAGLDEGSEAEGVDRKHMRLAENQLKLLSEIIAVHKEVIVILAGGSPVELPFEDQVKAILHGYLPGQGGGRALADVLTGTWNPSGKLAESYPLTYEDVISSTYYPGLEKTAEHRESIFVGYRHYDLLDQPVRYPFGHGLSYTSFAYSELKVEGPLVTLQVRNTGKRKGEEIVQIYVEPRNRKVFHEKRALKG
ncbi:MAG: glycoside hydrolase family 3 protein, partial [Clostridia bacterium]|nr:glycoside hydrolase family 3 protein [Clostridia bacterium]